MLYLCAVTVCCDCAVSVFRVLFLCAAAYRHDYALTGAVAESGIFFFFFFLFPSFFPFFF